MEAYPNEWFTYVFSRKDDYDFYLEFYLLFSENKDFQFADDCLLDYL